MTPRQIEYQQYRMTEHWKMLRQAVFFRDGFRCVRCPSEMNLQPHHLFYRERFEDSIPADLITLCRDCHETEHGIIPKRNNLGHRIGVQRVKTVKKPENPMDLIAECNNLIGKGFVPTKRQRKMIRLLCQYEDATIKSEANRICVVSKAIRRTKMFHPFQSNGTEYCSECGLLRGAHFNDERSIKKFNKSRILFQSRM